MAILKPFKPYRYSPAAGDPSKLVTQPYDKITPEMRARYLAASPYNVVRVLLGERRDSDNASDNVYTRAAHYLDEWIRGGILIEDAAPGFYAYVQEFEMPDSGDRLRRQGLIALGRVEDYAAGIVYRHEQTLTGPKRDRLELLRHTRAHFGQLLMLYSDADHTVDRILADAATGSPALSVLDEYGARHSLWPIGDVERIARIEEVIEPKKLLIADGHHRYETAVAYRNEHPDDPAAHFVMMTLVNMHSPGLKILATHRVVNGLEHFDPERFFEKAVKAGWSVAAVDSVARLKERMARPDEKRVQIGVIAPADVRLMQRARKDGQLDVPVLHQDVLGGLLGVTEEAVREERFLKYVRGIDAAAAEVDRGAQVAFVLEPVRVEDLARVAFAGGVMPQKSTDFYPKLLSGLTIYKL